jgi:hypothetical protein
VWERPLGVFIDLSIQGFNTVVDIASEVKFFGVKLDEFTPVIRTNSCTVRNSIYF